MIDISHCRRRRGFLSRYVYLADIVDTLEIITNNAVQFLSWIKWIHGRFHHNLNISQLSRPGLLSLVIN